MRIDYFIVETRNEFNSYANILTTTLSVNSEYIQYILKIHLNKKKMVPFKQQIKIQISINMLYIVCIFVYLYST